MKASAAARPAHCHPQAISTKSTFTRWHRGTFDQPLASISGEVFFWVDARGVQQHQLGAGW